MAITTLSHIRSASIRSRPVTVVTRTRGSGWDVDVIYGPHCAPTGLEADRRDGEVVALAEAELAIVLSGQQACMTIVRIDVLEWRAPTIKSS